LLVVSASTADVVRYIGGWLFDQVMAGRDVAVLTADPGDPRPLRILGARAYHLEAVLADTCLSLWSRDVAVQRDLYEADARVRRLARETLDTSRTDVLLWGAAWPQDPSAAVGMKRYRASVAARAFRIHALAAAESPGPDDGDELFWQVKAGPRARVRRLA
jgi:hypothetical protein